MLKNVRPVQPTSRRSRQTIHLRSNSELVEGVLRGRTVVGAEEVRRLRRDLARVSQERDILKKAAAFFANESS